MLDKCPKVSNFARNYTFRMKKDIEFPEVKNVQVAVARKLNEFGEYEWAVFLMNKNEFTIRNVMITSAGYGNKGDEEQKTSTLRHFIDDVAANGFAQIERIDTSVFGLTNEYWVSYWIGDRLFDKRYIFVPESIVETNLTAISLLEMEGVLHD